MKRALALAVIMSFATETAIARTSLPTEPKLIPRTTDGKPDLSGFWDHAFITSIARMDGAKSLVATDEEAKALSDGLVKWAFSEAAATIVDPDIFANTVTDLSRVGDEWRTSLITTPSDGVQHYTPAGKKMEKDYLARRNAPADGPEARPLFERCLVGIGSAPLTSVPQRMIRQFVQTPNNIVVSSDGNDTRIIGINALPRPASIISPLGDSVAHWEDDVLVVHTTGLKGQIHSAIITRPESRVIERFEMLTPDTILYRFTVEDTEIYADPFSAEFELHRTSEPVLEYSCHEGNYSMTNILQAARVPEWRARRHGS